MRLGDCSFSLAVEGQGCGSQSWGRRKASMEPALSCANRECNFVSRSMGATRTRIECHAHAVGKASRTFACNNTCAAASRAITCTRRRSRVAGRAFTNVELSRAIKPYGAAAQHTTVTWIGLARAEWPGAAGKDLARKKR